MLWHFLYNFLLTQISTLKICVYSSAYSQTILGHHDFGSWKHYSFQCYFSKTQLVFVLFCYHCYVPRYIVRYVDNEIDIYIYIYIYIYIFVNLEIYIAESFIQILPKLTLVIPPYCWRTNAQYISSEMCSQHNQWQGWKICYLPDVKVYKLLTSLKWFQHCLPVFNFFVYELRYLLL